VPEDDPVNPEETPDSPDASPAPEEAEPASPEPEADFGDDDISDILGQSDIDSLLASVAGDSDSQGAQDDEGEGTPLEEKVILYNGRHATAADNIRIEPYDFRNPVFLGEAEMRRLRLLHEEFIHFLEARLALFLRMDFSLTMTKLTTVAYDQAISEVENPSHLVVFKARPMPGVGFIEMSPRLGLTVASSILGGKGQAPRVERYLTQIEVDLIEEFIILVLQEWCSQWNHQEVNSQSYEPSILSHEVMASVLQICEHDTIMLSLSMEAQVRGCAGKLGICVPLYMIEEAVRKMQEMRRQESAYNQVKAKPAWRKAYEQIELDGEGSINVGRVKVSEIMKTWRPGTVIKLPEEAMQKVDLRLAGKPLFRCEAGVENGRIALNILEKKQTRGPLWNMKK
jgi:flagellar motor switch protein FliM